MRFEREKRADRGVNFQIKNNTTAVGREKEIFEKKSIFSENRLMIIVAMVVLLVISVYFQKQVWASNRQKKNANKMGTKSKKLMKQLADLEKKMQQMGSNFDGKARKMDFSKMDFDDLKNRMGHIQSKISNKRY